MLTRLKKIFFFIIALGMFFYSFFPVFAQENNQKSEEVFRARVTKILEERESVAQNGRKIIQQDLELRGIEGEWKEKIITVSGIDDPVVEKQLGHSVGDKVLVSRQFFGDEEIFYIVDAVRTGPIFFLFLLFIATVIIVGKKKGIKALAVLGVTFFIILKIMIPRLLSGADPLLVSVAGSLFILFIAVLGTEGWTKQSRIALVSIAFSLGVIVLLSYFFTALSRLTGLWSEEAMYVVTLGVETINMRGLLLAGFVIGALGVVDDVVISQVSLVEKLFETDPEMGSKELFSKAMRVGTDHIAAIVNTLFLAYAGASLPLLILFAVQQPPFETFSQIINNELIATEIVRTLVGSVGLVLTLPFATWLAVRSYKKYGVEKSADASLYSH